MAGLSEMRCEACFPGVPRMSLEDQLNYQKELQYWNIKDVDGVRRLFRVYSFPDFREAVIFTNKVSELAEIEGHHPRIITEYGKVTVSWWSHKINGLHLNDFVMAAKTDRIRNFDYSKL